MEEKWQLQPLSNNMPRPSTSQKVLEETPAPIKCKPSDRNVTKCPLFVHSTGEVMKLKH